MVTFECNGVAEVWRHNGMELTEGEKYQLEQRYLTIRDIVGSDEGNYTCTFNQETHSIGCLLVYGEIITVEPRFADTFGTNTKGPD